jgi:energy-coupling factor transport system ATP-binding protein
MLAIVGVTATLAGGSPQIRAGTVTFGLGGLLEFLRFTALSVVLLGMGALVSWTTNVAEIAPAVATLRVLYAARRLRPKETPSARMARLRRLATDVIDLVVAVITVTLRRADEMGDAIVARGGTGQISAAPSQPKRADWVALSIVSAVCAAALTAGLVFGG